MPPLNPRDIPTESFTRPTTPTTPKSKKCDNTRCECHCEESCGSRYHGFKGCNCCSPQHTSPEDKMKKGANLFARDFTQTMQELAGTFPKKKSNNWYHAQGFQAGEETERTRILAIIEKHKEDSRSDGSFKHDDCYDELTNEILK